MGISRDDPVFKAILTELLAPYIEAGRAWWADFENRTFEGTSTYPIEGGPPGFFEKCTRSPRQSPVYGIQAFPLVSVSFLNFPPGMKGGAIHLTDYLCKQGFKIEEFTVVSKFGINSSHMNGFFLCIIPTAMLESKQKARWVYMRPSEMVELASGIVTSTLAERVAPYAAEYGGDVV